MEPAATAAALLTLETKFEQQVAVEDQAADLLPHPAVKKTCCCQPITAQLQQQRLHPPGRSSAPSPPAPGSLCGGAGTCSGGRGWAREAPPPWRTGSWAGRPLLPLGLLGKFGRAGRPGPRAEEAMRKRKVDLREAAAPPHTHTHTGLFTSRAAPPSGRWQLRQQLTSFASSSPSPGGSSPACCSSSSSGSTQHSAPMLTEREERWAGVRGRV